MTIRIIHVGVGGRGRHWLDFVAQHPDFAAVLLALVADQKMRSTPGMFKIMWQQRVRQIWATGFRCDPEAKDVSRRIWRRFLLAHSQNRDPETFDTAVDELCAVAEELKL